MSVCQRCDTDWGWKQTMKKSTFAIGGGMTCPHCKEMQYISSSSRKLHILYVLVIIIPYFIYTLFDSSLSTGIIFVFIIYFMIIGINPFFIKLSNENESPF